MTKKTKKLLTDEQIDKEFEKIIREKMTDEQFWTWVSGWKDTETIIEETWMWDKEDKLDLINEFNQERR